MGVWFTEEADGGGGVHEREGGKVVWRGGGRGSMRENRKGKE